MRSISTLIQLTLLVSLSWALSACATVRPVPEVEFAEPESVGMSSEVLSEIQPALTKLSDAGKTPGFVTLVARNGKIVHHQAFGMRDVENGLPMEEDTIFRMFSMTKPVTAVAVMQLVEDGKIAVSDPVSKYIPEFGEMKVLVVNDDGSQELVDAETTMTVHHLLTHTSGLSYGLFNPLVAPYYEEAGIADFTNIPLEEFARRSASVPLLFEPGTDWEYSIAMDILGRIVEVASGESFAAYLENNIFRPLGMKDSAFWVPSEKQARFAALYEATEDRKGMKLTEVDGYRTYSAPPAMASGGGGMVGTALDYYRFAQALLNDGELDGVRILSEASAKEIKRDQLGPEFGETPLTLGIVPGRGLGFGYCGSVVREGAMPLFGNPGTYWWGGYASTDFWIDPQADLVGIVCTQLIPTASQPTRIIFGNQVYKAIVEGPTDEMAAAD